MGTMNDGTAISRKLRGMGFWNAHGSTEVNGGIRRIVGLGTPGTWANNNGIAVVYDEYGEPWIRRGALKRFDLDKFGRDELGLCGAYVPHSNDGGDFVRLILPGLR